MSKHPAFFAALLIMLFSLSLAGCGDNGDDMSQAEVEYLSHIDQARFFQRQGELKASTLEARSAIELNNANAEPYFIIVDNLLTAGDAKSALQQVNRIAEELGDQAGPRTHNRIALIRARAKMLLGRADEALADLETLRDPDRTETLQAATLRGDIHRRAQNIDDGIAAYQDARDIDDQAIEPVIGLSRLHWADDNPEQSRALIKEAEEIDKQDPELWLWKAQLAHSQQQYEKAEEAYIRALEDIGQYDVMTYRKYTTISALTDVLRQQGKSAEAFVYEEILAKSAPGTIKSNFEAAQTAYQEGNLAEAARFLEENLKQAPDHTRSAALLGMIRFRQGRVSDAEELLAPLADGSAGGGINRLLAATQLQLQKPEEARKQLERMENSDSDPGTLALIGISALAMGDTDTGRDYIQQSLEMAPDNHELRFRYASWLVSQGKTNEGIQQAERIKETEAFGDQARALIIKAHRDAGNQTAARETASAWVKAAPDNINALMVRGDIALSQGDVEDARQYLEQARSVADGNPGPDIALGVLASREDRREDARRHFKTAVGLAPNNRRALKGLLDVTDESEGIAFLRETLNKHPDAAGPRLLLLEHALRENNMDEANTLTAPLLEREAPDTPAPAERLVAGIYNGVAAQKIQNAPAQAKAILERAQALFPKHEDIQMQTARLHLSQNDRQKARSILDQAKVDHPDSARPYLLEARYEVSQGNTEAGIELYQLALEKEPSPQIYLNYAQTLRKTDQPNKALETLKSAVNDFPDSAAVRLGLAVSYQNQGENEKAVREYEAVLEASPNNATALNNLAWLHHQSGKPEARELARRAYELAPDSAAVADTYGWILFQQGDHSESVTILEKAHQLDPEMQEIALHLAEAYKATNQQSKAKAILEKM
ncbi:hypothetical protein CF392_02515 [Tamilnaduibacter salinus]|uniref:Uncharacterized protein n=1 Tax=Tamilnaduibacter salinus TaxID=1484056 RepID=A0A2A2I7D2_9GAMM|nr:tetratricopeptide repeat protein [Tamilnaduibacter salinus]PAV27030.1 hypothetical protein CF392_02515 [Tamilnaduibacter salinus]